MVSELARLRAQRSFDPSQFNVGLIPFRLNQLTRGVNPNKLYEYLAAGIPVVSTRFSEEVLGYPDVCRAVDAGEDFASACEKTIAELNDGRRAGEIRKSALQVARDNDWNVIAETFWKKVKEMGDQKQMKGNRS